MVLASELSFIGLSILVDLMCEPAVFSDIISMVTLDIIDNKVNDFVQSCYFLFIHLFLESRADFISD